MPAEQVVFLAVQAPRSPLAASARTEGSMVYEDLVAERLCLPAEHPRRRDCNPVHPDLHGYVASDLLEALAPEELTAAGDVFLTFETVSSGVISVLDEDRASNPEGRVRGELGEQRFQVVSVEGQIGVQITNHVVLEMSHAFVPGAERKCLGCEAALELRRQMHGLDPGMPRSTLTCDCTGPIR